MDVDDIPMQIQQLVQGSVTTRSPIRFDSLGLPYPGAKPIPCIGATIKEVVVKSVVEYKLVNTDYVLELTLFRTWIGSDTTRDPVLSTAVAMYHNDWDDEMGRLTPTTGDRIWARPLKTFFGKGVGFDETDIGTKGVERFIAEVEAIQGLLADATMAADMITKQQQVEAETVIQALQESLEERTEADAVAQAMHLSLQEFEISDGANTVIEVARDITDTQYGDEAARDQHSRANSIDFPLLNLPLGSTPLTQNNADEVECIYGDLYSAD
jgi:hypothetical protein